MHARGKGEETRDNGRAKQVDLLHLYTGYGDICDNNFKNHLKFQPSLCSSTLLSCNIIEWSVFTFSPFPRWLMAAVSESGLGSQALRLYRLCGEDEDEHFLQHAHESPSTPSPETLTRAIPLLTPSVWWKSANKAPPALWPACSSCSEVAAWNDKIHVFFLQLQWFSCEMRSWSN